MNHLRPALIAIALSLSGVGLQADQLDDFLDRLKKTAKDDAGFAAQILEAARGLADEPELRSRLYEKAYEYGISHPNGYATALEAARALLKAKPKQRRIWQEKLVAVYELRFKKCGRSERKKAGEELIRQLVALADELIMSGSDTPRAVAYFVRASLLVARYAPFRQAEVTYKLAAARQRQRLEKEEDACKLRLKKNPNDHVARDRLIRIYVAEFDAPAKAQKLLRSDVAEDWQTHVPLAVKDVGKLTQAVRFKLGGWYKGLSEKASVAGKPRALSRSKAYYERFLLGERSGVRAVMAKMDLETIEKELKEIAKARAPSQADGPFTRKVRIPARKDWTAVVRVSSGDVIDLVAEGKWSPKRGVVLGPEGNVYVRAHHLQGRLGEDSRPFRVGAKHAVTARMNCMLYLGMKDDWNHHDNSGFLTVTVTVRKKK